MNFGRAPLAAAAFASVALVGNSAQAATSGSTRAAALLERAYHSTTVTAYSGVQYVTAWGDDGVSSLVIEIAHEPHIGSYVQVASTATAPEARGFDPDSGVTPTATPTIPGLAAEPLLLLKQHYDLRLAPDDLVAGRPAEVVQAWRNDGTLAASFWLDVATGLVLRRELFDTAGRLVRASAYVSIRIGQPVQLPPVAKELSPQPAGQTLTPVAQAQLRRAKWHIASKLPGGLTLYDARSWVDSGRRVVHLSYSDGLSTISLFEQRGHLSMGPMRGWHRQRVHGGTVYAKGTEPEQLVWSAHGVVYTLVGDAPEDVMQAALLQLPRSHDEDNGFLARIGRGLKRIGSWLNPF